jgi:hypothetical protein
MKAFFKERNDGKPLIEQASSLKLKTQSMMLGIISKSLRHHKEDELLEKFRDTLKKSKSTNEQKRVFISNYGYENSREYILGETNELKKAQNYDKFKFESVIAWWKKMANKRYDKLKVEDRLRTELELWNEKTDIDIIR